MPQTFTKELDAFDRELRAKGYEPLKPFFVLREADIADERTGGKVRLNKDRLERIAETQNMRVATTGDATPIIVGHTRRHLLEKEQPPIAGLATRFEVVKFKNTNSWGLQATPWALPHDKILFQQFPRRSCELWTDPDLIDPISLLGANTPRLDLGLHQLSQNQQLALHLGYRPRTSLSLEMDGSMPNDNENESGNGDSGKPATPNNVTAAEGTQTSEFAQMKAQLDQMQQMMGLLKPLLDELQMGGGMDQGAPPPGPGGPGGPGGPPPGPMGPAPGPIQAMGTPPGGMNAMIPQQFGRQDGQQQFQHYGYAADGTPLYRPVAVQQPMQFQQPQFTPPVQPQGQPLTLQAMQAELEKVRTQNAQLQLARLGDEVNMVLNDLEKRIVIDRQRDYNDLIKMEKPQRDAAIQFMLSTRKPVEEPVPPEALPLQFHREPPQMQAPIQNAPMQLGNLGESMYMPPDPNLGKPRPGTPSAVSTYDALMDIVRNRGKLSNTEAFDQAMEAARNGNMNGTPVR